MRVGDVVIMNAGDKVPADCLVIEASQLTVDEPQRNEDGSFIAGQVGVVQKSRKNDPFLIADSYIRSGFCKALVTSVGECSTRGKNDAKLDTRSDTPLQNKLQTLANSFTFIGLIGALVILITSIVILCIQTGASEEVGGTIFTKKLIENITLAVVIIIVAIPEGLPMATAMSLAYSVGTMHAKDGVLVRELDSPERIGCVDEICTGKTGTLTTEDMIVTCFHVSNLFIINARKDTLMKSHMDSNVRDILTENIIYNSSSHIEINENAFYVPVGNGTECSLIRWLQGAEIPVHTIMEKKEGNVLYHQPFSTEKKASLIAIKHPDMVNRVRVYRKGAPENIFEKCTTFFTETGEQKNMTDQSDLSYFTDQILSPQMTQKGMRAIAFSYRDFDMDHWDRIQADKDF